MTCAELLARLDGAKRAGDAWQARCPAHEDTTPSLSVREGRDGRVLVYCHAGCAVEAVTAALGLAPKDLFADTPGGRDTIAATYDYHDARGTLLYQVVRFLPKDFRQRRPDGLGGWTWNLNGTPRVLYRLPAVLAGVARGDRVWVVEGEKDADTLTGRGQVATTNPGGAGKWRTDYGDALRGARVVLVSDNDAPGRAHTRAVRDALAGVAADVVVVAPPGAKDVTAHLEAGGKLAALAPLVEHITPLGAGRYRVPGTAAPFYDVDVAAGTCPCADFVHHGRERPCKHLGQAAAHAGHATAAPAAAVTVPPADTLTHIRDLLAEPDDPVSWIVEGLLPAGGVSILASKPKAGKSTTARALALHVARGASFLGRTTERGPVLYLGLEDPRRVTRGHLRTLGARDDDALYVFTGKRPADALAWLGAMLDAYDPVLVIVDTQQRLTAIADLNDYAKVTAALEPLLALVRPRRAHLMLLHHAGKGERQGFDAVLGSTGFVGTADVILLLRRREDDTRTLASLQRMGDDLPESVLTLDAQRAPQLGPPKAEFDAIETGQRIMTFLDGQDTPVSRALVLEGVEGRAELVGRALGRLVQAGDVTRTGAGKRGSPFLFCRSHYTPGIAESNPQPGTSSRQDATISVPEFPGLGNGTADPGNGIPSPLDPDMVARDALREGV